ncbi:uncharacterized protein LOC131937256 [Physella acuta]|uniref:uncharacterized protein LOC131937256 n=1 Tax=Physella acuta TaxID=109671 RepID=UPI0027DCD915|nr:uncharacterized protein LOC131937256 [Physella acuta]
MHKQLTQSPTSCDPNLDLEARCVTSTEEQQAPLRGPYTPLVPAPSGDGRSGSPTVPDGSNRLDVHSASHPLQAYNHGLSTGLQGTNQTSHGLQGTNQTSHGLQGTNQTSHGLQGTNQTSHGLQGTNQTSHGLQGTNQTSHGLQGTNQTSHGLQGTNQTSHGLQGTNQTSHGLQGTNQTMEALTLEAELVLKPLELCSRSDIKVASSITTAAKNSSQSLRFDPDVTPFPLFSFELANEKSPAMPRVNTFGLAPSLLGRRSSEPLVNRCEGTEAKDSQCKAFAATVRSPICKSCFCPAARVATTAEGSHHIPAESQVRCQPAAGAVTAKLPDAFGDIPKEIKANSEETTAINPASGDLRSTPVANHSEEECCRICQDDGTYEKLVSPCYCSGTVGFVHMSCLETWLGLNGRTACELCSYPFPVVKIHPTIWQYFRRPLVNMDFASLLCDIACFCVLTPLLVASTYLCSIGVAHYEEVGKTGSVFAIVTLMISLIAVYISWAVLAVLYHRRVFLTWREKTAQIRMWTDKTPPPMPRKCPDTSHEQAHREDPSPAGRILGGMHVFLRPMLWYSSNMRPTANLAANGNGNANINLIPIHLPHVQHLC